MEITDSMILEMHNVINIGDLSRFRTLISACPKQWCQILMTPTSYPLIHKLMLLVTRKDMFDEILPYHDLVDLERSNAYGQTALQCILKCELVELKSVEYYATQLIDHGAFIHGTCSDGSSLLHLAVKLLSVNITNLLLSKNINLDVADELGDTALLKLMSLKPGNEIVDELVTTLLCCGADPHFRSNLGFNAFELALINKHSTLIKELLFFYTFNENKRINLKTFREFSSETSRLVDVLNVAITGAWSIHHTKHLFEAPIELFNFFLATGFCKKFLKANVNVSKKCTFRGILSNRVIQVNLGSFFVVESDDLLEKMNLILKESPATKSSLINFLANLNPISVFNGLSQSKFYNQMTATNLLMFMFENGLPFGAQLLHPVYSRYGFCELFKFLLSLKENVEIESGWGWCHKNVMVMLICDPLLDLKQILKIVIKAKCLLHDVHQLVYYFAPTTTLRMILQSPDIEPQVPRLLELARNATRKYLARKYKISDRRKFFEIVKTLPVGEIHQKIITLETPLYSDQLELSSWAKSQKFTGQFR